MCGITQGCAFWGSKYLILIFDPYLPPKCQILPKNSNFKPKWWNMKVQVYQKLLKQCTWKFDTMLRTWKSVLRCNMMTSQQFQYGGRPPYWKSSFGYISKICCPINAKFCVKKQNHIQTQVTWPKYRILKIQDGGRPPFWKRFYRYISAGNHQISMKFGVQIQILFLRTVTCQSVKILQIQNGGRPPYWKWSFCYIS